MLWKNRIVLAVGAEVVLVLGVVGGGGFHGQKRDGGRVGLELGELVFLTGLLLVLLHDGGERDDGGLDLDRVGSSKGEKSS